MSIFPNLRIAIQIGPITIAWYAIFIIIGIAIAYTLSIRNFKRMGYSTDRFDSLAIGIVIIGILGARLWYVIFDDPSYYFANLPAILEIWNGGLAIQGGLMTGALYAFFYCRKYKMNFLRVTDAVLPNVLLAQAAGRWGNFMNQEAFGRVVSESFYRYFPTWFKNIMYINHAYREPTFLYESCLNILGWVVIVLLLKRILAPRRGNQTYGYLVWYGIIRFFVEGLRSDSLMFMGLRTAQMLSILSIFIGLLGFAGVYQHLFKRRKPVILFDFDGTLMDTQEAITLSFREVFKRHMPEKTLTQDEELSFVGPSLENTFSRYFPEAEVAGLVDEYRVINQGLHNTVKPMPGAVKMLEKMKQAGYHLGVVSSKRSAVIELGMEPFNLKSYFDVIIGSDHVEEHKPSPQGILKALEHIGEGQDEAIYIGDVATDIEAGVQAGVYTIGYLNNELMAKRLKEGAKPNQFISDWDELERIVKEDHEWTFNLM